MSPEKGWITRWPSPPPRSSSMGFEGTRLPDTPLGDVPSRVIEEEWTTSYPGAYWKVMSRKEPSVPLTPSDINHGTSPENGNLTNTVWGVITPNGLYGMLSIHTVREEDDGTISIRPGDGSSNSVLVTYESLEHPETNKSWHGYIEHGIWSEC